jgi:hypothetical protein
MRWPPLGWPYGNDHKMKKQSVSTMSSLLNIRCKILALGTVGGDDVRVFDIGRDRRVACCKCFGGCVFINVSLAFESPCVSVDFAVVTDLEGDVSMNLRTTAGISVSITDLDLLRGVPFCPMRRIRMKEIVKLTTWAYHGGGCWSIDLKFRSSMHVF